MEWIPFFLFNKYNNKKYFLKILAADFCPKNLDFARKMMALPELQPPGSYAYAL